MLIYWFKFKIYTNIQVTKANIVSIDSLYVTQISLPRVNTIIIAADIW